jgi:molybdopterin-guanine dinucleotide biosynthesis protein A
MDRVTGAVLAGGRSTRLGRDKALLALDGEPLLARAVRLLREVCAEVLVVGPLERASVVPGVRVLADERPSSGPLGGIATALRAMSGDRLLAVATDMPFLRPALLRYLLTISTGFDVTVPRVEGRTHQLCAVYSRACLPLIDAQLARGEYKIDRFFGQVRLRVVEEDELRPFDPELLSFRNVNTEADWQAVQAIAARMDTGERPPHPPAGASADPATQR